MTITHLHSNTANDNADSSNTVSSAIISYTNAHIQDQTCTPTEGHVLKMSAFRLFVQIGYITARELKRGGHGVKNKSLALAL